MLTVCPTSRFAVRSNPLSQTLKLYIFNSKGIVVDITIFKYRSIKQILSSVINSRSRLYKKYYENLKSAYRRLAVRLSRLAVRLSFLFQTLKLWTFSSKGTLEVIDILTYRSMKQSFSIVPQIVMTVCSVAILKSQNVNRKQQD